jgi:hypothetical protein
VKISLKNSLWPPSQDDRKSLEAFSLVCKARTNPARDHLFTSLSISELKGGIGQIKAANVMSAFTPFLHDLCLASFNALYAKRRHNHHLLISSPQKTYSPANLAPACNTFATAFVTRTPFTRTVIDSPRFLLLSGLSIEFWNGFVRSENNSQSTPLI